MRPVLALLLLAPALAWADPDDDPLPDTMPALRETPDPELVQDDWPEPTIGWWWGAPVIEAPSDVVVVTVPVEVPGPCDAEPEVPLDGPDRTGADGIWVAPDAVTG